VEHELRAPAGEAVRGIQGPRAHHPALGRAPRRVDPRREGEGKPFSSFAIGGPMTELILLGHVAMLAGHPIEYDAGSGKIVNRAEANPFLHREYRAGWTL